MMAYLYDDKGTNFHKSSAITNEKYSCTILFSSNMYCLLFICAIYIIEFSTTDIITVSKSKILERPAGYNYTSVKKLNSYLLSQHFRTSDSTQIGEHARTYTPLATPFWKKKKQTEMIIRLILLISG